MPRVLIERLPNLRLLAITGVAHRTLDLAAATARGVLVCHTAAHPDAHQDAGTHDRDDAGADPPNSTRGPADP